MGVELLLPVQQVAVFGLLDGRDHFFSYLPFVAHPVPGIMRQENLGLTQAIRVVSAAVDRVGDPGEAAIERASDLHVHAGGLVLAGVQLRVRGP